MILGTACSWYMGGAERAGLEAPLDMQTKDTTALVIDLAEAFEKVQLTVAWRWATNFGFPQRVLKGT